LKAHKPVGNINFNKDTIVVFYEDDPAANIVELSESVGKPTANIAISAEVRHRIDSLIED